MAQLTEQLNLLHLNYKATTAKLASIPALEDASAAVIPGETTRMEKTMTKTQYQLTCEEGKLWEQVANAQTTLTSGEYDVTQQELDNMLNRSYAMATSFQRRNNTPTVQTYSESKEILEAMGVLCIDATGAVEGEALASSIVLSGHADYVATEDTVCTLMNTYFQIFMKPALTGCTRIRSAHDTKSHWLR
jgi:flap endonuclease-1